MKQWNDRYDRYVGHYSMYQDNAGTNPQSLDRISFIDSDIGRQVDFKRVSPHHITLPPGCRTSYPHAESLEEEFIYVLKGNPHLWINGYLHELGDGHAVGFPAGTGIAHTVLNNSDDDIHLLVAGERTKADNLCSFPINPEQRASCKIWWENPLTHDLGPHLGIPGAVRSSDLGRSPVDCLVHCPSESPGRLFHYPGDDETFAEGFRISDRIGLKALGIWYQRLRPGKRSAFPHAHTHEEEFVFVLKGNPTVWIDGFAKRVEPGWFAAFPPNTGSAHVVINDTNEEVIYLCIGESADFPDERISYPWNKLRQQECERKGWYWSNTPTLPQGSVKPTASKTASNSVGDHLAFRLSDEALAVFSIFEKSPTYFQRVDGTLPTLATAEQALVDGPKERNEKYFKEFLIIDLNRQPVGVLDLHANYPQVGVCYLGLLLITEDHFGNGLGRRSYKLAEDYIKRALGCSRILLGVSDSNDVSKFWEKQGFTYSKKSHNLTGGENGSIVREFEKDIL